MARRYQLSRSASSVLDTARVTAPISPCASTMSSGITSRTVPAATLCTGIFGRLTEGPCATCGGLSGEITRRRTAPPRDEDVSHARDFPARGVELAAREDAGPGPPARARAEAAIAGAAGVNAAVAILGMRGGTT